jgi:hypothetical protein
MYICLYRQHCRLVASLSSSCEDVYGIVYGKCIGAEACVRLRVSDASVHTHTRNIRSSSESNCLDDGSMEPKHVSKCTLINYMYQSCFDGICYSFLWA